MRFTELFERAEVKPDGIEGDAEIGGLSADSRTIEPGQVFVCMPSEHTDSHQFVESAIEKGAKAVIVNQAEAFESHRGKAPVAWVDVSVFGESIWRLAKIGFDDPSSKLTMIGVTGTNGKTTVAWMLKEMLAAQGRQSGYLGTIGFHTPSQSRLVPNTTPFVVEVNQMLDAAVRQGVDAMAMEVSSHALAQRRVDGVEFDAAVLTNLTHDHLDFHGTMEDYAAAKRRLFVDLPAQSSKPFCAALNIDDEFGFELAAELDFGRLTFGKSQGDLTFKAIQVGADQVEIQFTFRGAKKAGHARIGGSFNVENCASAVAGMLALGHSFDAAIEALHAVGPAPGRFESIPTSRGFHVIVDYAHTPDALEKLLDAALELRPRRLITVFGCGGDRDRRKRPMMARIASERSDLSVVTSDNPRSEDPESIIDQVMEGLASESEAVAIIDRRKAIEYAVRHAESGDLVVIAGKGHEDYQIIGRTKHPMDDRLMAKEALEALP